MKYLLTLTLVFAVFASHQAQATRTVLSSQPTYRPAVLNNFRSPGIEWKVKLQIVTPLTATATPMDFSQLAAGGDSDSRDSTVTLTGAAGTTINVATQDANGNLLDANDNIGGSYTTSGIPTGVTMSGSGGGAYTTTTTVTTASGAANGEYSASFTSDFTQD